MPDTRKLVFLFLARLRALVLIFHTVAVDVRVHEHRRRRGGRLYVFLLFYGTGLERFESRGISTMYEADYYPHLFTIDS